LSDTAININPTALELAKIAIMTAKTARMFGVEPVIWCHFLTLDLPPMKMPLKREAVAYLHEHHPDMIVDGEVQGILL
jgi:malate dehydrogenase (oxaloacetate-decarboxylating)(NADP+)